MALPLKFLMKMIGVDNLYDQFPRKRSGNCIIRGNVLMLSFEKKLCGDFFSGTNNIIRYSAEILKNRHCFTGKYEKNENRMEAIVGIHKKYHKT